MQNLIYLVSENESLLLQNRELLPKNSQELEIFGDI
jgi:hypothetical protein